MFFQFPDHLIIMPGMKVVVHSGQQKEGQDLIGLTVQIDLFWTMNRFGITMAMWQYCSMPTVSRSTDMLIHTNELWGAALNTRRYWCKLQMAT